MQDIDEESDEDKDTSPFITEQDGVISTEIPGNSAFDPRRTQNEFMLTRTGSKTKRRNNQFGFE